MNNKPKTIKDLLAKKLPKDVASKYVELIQDLMFEEDCRLLPDDIETDEQYVKNVHKEIQELRKALKDPKQYKLKNIGLVLAALGLTILSQEVEDDESDEVLEK